MDVLGVEDEEVVGGDMTDGTKTLHDPVLPSVSVCAKHTVTQIPFADWCERCVKRNAVSTKHERRDVQLRLVLVTVFFV